MECGVHRGGDRDVPRPDIRQVDPALLPGPVGQPSVLVHREHAPPAGLAVGEHDEEVLRSLLVAAPAVCNLDAPHPPPTSQVHPDPLTRAERRMKEEAATGLHLPPPARLPVGGAQQVGLAGGHLDEVTGPLRCRCDQPTQRLEALHRQGKRARQLGIDATR